MSKRQKTHQIVVTVSHDAPVSRRLGVDPPDAGCLCGRG